MHALGACQKWLMKQTSKQKKSRVNRIYPFNKRTNQPTNKHEATKGINFASKKKKRKHNSKRAGSDLKGKLACSWQIL